MGLVSKIQSALSIAIREKNRHDLLLPVPWYLVTFTLPDALRYLSRYLLKTATGNRRVIEVSKDRVLFPWRERSSGK